MQAWQGVQGGWTLLIFSSTLNYDYEVYVYPYTFKRLKRYGPGVPATAPGGYTGPIGIFGHSRGTDVGYVERLLLF